MEQIQLSHWQQIKSAWFVVWSLGIGARVQHVALTHSPYPFPYSFWWRTHEQPTAVLPLLESIFQAVPKPVFHLFFETPLSGASLTAHFQQPQEHRSVFVQHLALGHMFTVTACQGRPGNSVATKCR